MSKKQDLIGNRYGNLVVVGEKDSIGGNSRWLCKCDCGNSVVVFGYNLKSKHTQSCGCLQKRRTSESVKKYNKYDLSGEFGIGETTNNNSLFYFDIEDYDKIKEFTWLINDQGYIVARNTKDNKPQFIRMHRLLLDAKNDDIIDHKNLNKKDNRKSNLRFANKQLNGINRPHNSNNKTGVKGVEYYGENKYVARIMINGKNIHLGIYDTLEKAKQARIKKEQELFGEFAYMGA